MLGGREYRLVQEGAATDWDRPTARNLISKHDYALSGRLRVTPDRAT